MSKSDAPGYEIFWGGVMWFSGFFRVVRYEAAGLKKVPGYIKLGRSGRHAPWRPFESEFWEFFGKAL